MKNLRKIYIHWLMNRSLQFYFVHTFILSKAIESLYDSFNKYLKNWEVFAYLSFLLKNKYILPYIS